MPVVLSPGSWHLNLMEPLACQEINLRPLGIRRSHLCTSVPVSGSSIGVALASVLELWRGCRLVARYVFPFFWHRILVLCPPPLHPHILPCWLVCWIAVALCLGMEWLQRLAHRCWTSYCGLIEALEPTIGKAFPSSPLLFQVAHAPSRFLGAQALVGVTLGSESLPVSPVVHGPSFSKVVGYTSRMCSYPLCRSSS